MNKFIKMMYYREKILFIYICSLKIDVYFFYKINYW